MAATKDPIDSIPSSRLHAAKRSCLRAAESPELDDCETSKVLRRSWMHGVATIRSANNIDNVGALISRTAQPLCASLHANDLYEAELHLTELTFDLRASGEPRLAVLAVGRALQRALQGLPERCGDLRRLDSAPLYGRAVAAAYEPTASTPVLESTARAIRPRAPAQRGNSDALARLLVGSSPAMVRLRSEVAAIARTSGNVYIIGESGTGKELIAQALHQLGAPAGSPLQCINCAALPRELIESELFGHTAGAFTGGQRASQGLMRAAGNGTLFLDELVDMPLELQPKLLRALEQRRVRPVGGLTELPIQARVVAASNRDPHAAQQAGSLRSDLFFRLCVHRVDVPPLRARRDDIPLLLDYFARRLNQEGRATPRRIAPEAMELLYNYSWPGNVRELRNVVEHFSAFADDDTVHVEDVPSYLQEGHAPSKATPVRGGTGPMPEASKLESLDSVIAQHLRRALQVTGGNKTRAAKLLGVSRHQLYIRLQQLQLVDD